MPDHLRLRIRRYLTAQEFASDMEQLKAFHGTSVSDRLLESLEKHGLLRPKVRLRWPDPVARRSGSRNTSNLGFLHEAVEPDGARWEATLRLQDSLLRANHRAIYGNVPHPFDDPEPAFVEFLQGPADRCFLGQVASICDWRSHDTAEVRSSAFMPRISEIVCWYNRCQPRWPSRSFGLNRRSVRPTAFDKAHVVSQEAARTAVQEVPNLDRRQREYRG